MKTNLLGHKLPNGRYIENRLSMSLKLQDYLARQMRKVLHHKIETKMRFNSFLFWKLSSFIHNYLLEKSRPTKPKGHGYIWASIMSVVNVLIRPKRPSDKEAQTPM